MASLTPRTVSAASLVFRETAVIAADAARVWAALADLARYREWNPWLVHAHGELRPGGVVWADVVLRGRNVRAKHLVLVVEPGLRLCWRDAGWNAWFVYAQRSRTLTARAGAVELTQELVIEGPLRGLVERRYGESLRAGLAAETAALKHFVEHRSV